MMKGFFSYIFSCTNVDNHKVINILGIKLKFKRKQMDLSWTGGNHILSSTILYGVQRLISTAYLHRETFLPFKNKHQNEKVALVGCGPSLNYFTPVKNVYYCGLNRAFLFDKIKFDYLFAIDNWGLVGMLDDFINYNPKCIKFIGDQNRDLAGSQIPESSALKIDCLRYKTTVPGMDMKIAYDLSCEPLGQFCSVSFHALQFLMYTNPKTIYLIGIDCNIATAGHFKGQTVGNFTKMKFNDKYAVEVYKMFKDFAQEYYPETEIISINPVGLKGVFKDVYTEEYLNAHPEINKNEVEIFDKEVV